MYWFFVLISISIIYCVTSHHSELGWKIDLQAQVVQWQTPYTAHSHTQTPNNRLWFNLNFVNCFHWIWTYWGPTVCTIRGILWRLNCHLRVGVCECEENNVNGYQQRNNTPDMIRPIPIGAYFRVSSSQFPWTRNGSEWAESITMFQFIVVVVYRLGEFIDNS